MECSWEYATFREDFITIVYEKFGGKQRENYGELETENAHFISSDEAKLISLRNQLLWKHDQNTFTGGSGYLLSKTGLAQTTSDGKGGVQTPQASSWMKL